MNFVEMGVDLVNVVKLGEEYWKSALVGLKKEREDLFQMLRWIVLVDFSGRTYI